MLKLGIIFNFFLNSVVFFLLGVAVTLYAKDKYDLSFLSKNIGIKNQKGTAAAPTKNVDWLKIQTEVLPNGGFTLDTPFNDLGPKLVRVGAINIKKMEQNFANEGGLTEGQKTILTKKTETPISINRENANFMIDFFWALGLANKNSILDKSPMAANKKELGNFASTGGWTLGTKKATDLFSKYEIIKLTPEQQTIVEEVAQNVYRPCCGNPTSFPDCNHGMAALGLAEYLASRGKGADDIYKAILYFNSFWFPQNYMDVAAYFNLTGNSWTNTSPKIILGAQFSSGQGYARIKQELNTKLGVPAPAAGSGRGCST